MIQESQESTVRVYLIAANAVLGSFFYGYALAYMNVCLDTVNVVFGVPEGDVNFIDGLISALLPIGAAMGAFLSGPILSCISRRNSMILADFIGVAGTALGLVVNLYTLYAARLVIGLSVGMNTALVPLYIKEYTPLHMRGSAGSLIQITLNTGILVAASVGYGFPADNPNNDFWKVVFIIPVITCILRMVILLFIFPEDPPGYYIAIGNEKKAVKVLAKVYKDGHVSVQLDELKNEEMTKKQNSSKYSDLLTPLYRRRFLVGVCLCLLQQLCGINAVTFYSIMIFQSISADPLVYNGLNVGAGIGNIVFSMFTGLLIKRFGRKQLLFWGDFICFASLVGLSAFSFVKDREPQDYYDYLIIFFLFTYIFGFQISIGPIVLIYIAEVLPEKGVSLACLSGQLATSIITFSFPVLYNAAGIYVCFLIFAGCCFLGLIFIKLFVKETKNRRAISIDHMYSLVQALKDPRIIRTNFRETEDTSKSSLTNKESATSYYNKHAVA